MLAGRRPADRPAAVAALVGETMTNNNLNLQANVAAELSWDPRVDSERIAVSAVGGFVTLRGTVGCARQKRAAQLAARRVSGVSGISDYLRVRVQQQDRRADDNLRADVLRAFGLNGLVPATVCAGVADGVVTLSGTAIWQYQRDEAELVCASVPGVLAVDDEISLTPEPADGDAEEAIRACFRRSARLGRYGLSADIPYPGTLVLSGTVSSWAEHDDALAAAWSAPGIAEVDDRIAVES